MSSAVEIANMVVRDVSRAQDEKILADEKLWQVVSSGDLKGLTPKQKSDYYLYRCRQEGLNPASQPFQYVTFQGKEVLYGGKTASDQLRKLHGISITAVDCQDDGEFIVCEVRVSDREGREDFETGIVYAGTARGVERANAKMKALTKAKRRATYSICGTGVMDETEVETIPGVRYGKPIEHGLDTNAEDLPVRQAEEDAEDVIDTDTGEIHSADALYDAIKAERERLGWDTDTTTAYGREKKFNLHSMDGLRQLRDALKQEKTPPTVAVLSDEDWEAIEANDD